MTFWLIAGFLTLAVAGFLVWPLFRSRPELREGADYDIEVFRDQLAEVDRDLARSAVSVEEAEAARVEIGRRILAADAHRGNLQTPAEGLAHRLRPIMAGLLVVIVAGGAAALYRILGAPGLPALPFAERAAPASADKRSLDLAQLAKRLQTRLERTPDDHRGWRLLGRTYMALSRYPAAVTAYERALGLEDGDAGLHASYGESLTLRAEGTVTPAGRTAFEAALTRDPKEPMARYYLALAAYQAGEKKKALKGWTDLIADLPADVPWLSLVRSRAEKAATELGLDVAAVIPAPRPAARRPAPASSGGPSAEDLAAAAKMSPADRKEMIEGMVAGLAARLEKNPKDFQGWMRLIRSYVVIGEKEKAAAALATALETFKAAPFVKQQFLHLAGELKLQTSRGKGGGAPGPSAADVKAAGQMTPAERREMIEGMVARLAARLETKPNDLEGWIRLGRSYNVLGQRVKARDAMARASTLAPRNIDILILYGRTIRAAAGDRQTAESTKLMRRILEMDADNVEALWPRRRRGGPARRSPSALGEGDGGPAARLARPRPNARTSRGARKEIAPATHGRNS